MTFNQHLGYPESWWDVLSPFDQKQIYPLEMGTIKIFQRVFEFSEFKFLTCTKKN